MTANERLKESFGSWLWGSILLATVMHFALIAYWPELEAADVSFSMDELTAIEIPPVIEIPPAPEAITRPANPVVSSAVIDENITIAPTTPDAFVPTSLPPPPVTGVSSQGAAPGFTPFEVRPEIRNVEEVRGALVRAYPALLRDARIGGTVLMWFYIDAQGVVQDRIVAESSGHAQLDDAALQVAPLFQFTPALNRDERVPVWVQIPVEFTPR